MSILQQAGLGLKALMFDRNAIKSIMEKNNGWVVTFLIWIIYAVLLIPMALLTSTFDTTTGPAMELWMIIGFIIIAPIGLIINTGIIHVPAKLLGGKGTAMNMYKSIGSISIINLISWIPVLNILVFIWILVVETLIVSEVHQLSITKSILAVMIILIILVIMFLSLGIFAYLGPLNPSMFT